MAVVKTLIYVWHTTAQHKAQAQHKNHKAYALSMQRQKKAMHFTIHKVNTNQL